MVTAYLLLFTFLHQVFGESCVFPSYMDGNWSDSKFYAVQFFDRNLMFLPGYSISRVGSSTNMTCYLNQGNQYVLRTTKAINAKANGKVGDYYFYICMEITQITSYSFYYYLQTETDLNNERTVAVANTTAPDGLSAICTTSISLQLYHIMVKDGFEREALQTCSTPLLTNYNFEFSVRPVTCTTRGSIVWDIDDSSQKIFNISYSSNCDIKFGNSKTSSVGCLLCIKSNTTFITSMVNLDDNVDDVFYYKFSCVISASDEPNVTLTQRARVCHLDQTASSMPSTTAIYPIDRDTVVAYALLNPSGVTSAATSNCFPRTSTQNTGSSKSHAWIAAVVIIILLLILLVIGLINWWKRLKEKCKIRDKGSPRRRHFKIDLRTAVLAGLGSSRQRQKSFIRQEGSDILIIQNDKKSETKSDDLQNGTITSTKREEENKIDENNRHFESNISVASTINPISDVNFVISTNMYSDLNLENMELDNTCDEDGGFEQTETIPQSVMVFPTKDNAKQEKSVVHDITEQNTSEDVTVMKENSSSTIFSQDNVVHKNERVAVGRLKISSNLVTEKHKPHNDIENARRRNMKIENDVVQNDPSFIPPTDNNHERNSQQQIKVENDSPSNVNENYVVQHDPSSTPSAGNIHETNSQQQIGVENDSFPDNVKNKPLFGYTDGFQHSRVDPPSGITSFEGASSSHNAPTNTEISNTAKITSQRLQGESDHVRFSAEEKLDRKFEEKNTMPNKDSSRPNSVGIEKLQLDKLHVSDHKLQNEKKLKMRKQLMKKKSPFAGTKSISRK